MLAALSLAFRGVVVGSLLGDAVAVQVRGVDYIAVAATVVLGVLAVADAVFLNITERSAELAAIRAFGWRESTLSRLVVTEGAAIGLLGSLAGAAIGLSAAAVFAGQFPARLLLAAAAAAWPAYSSPPPPPSCQPAAPPPARRAPAGRRLTSAGRTPARAGA